MPSVERRPTFHLERLAGIVCAYEDRMVEGRIVAPPSLPRVVAPRPRAATEHVPTHDGRAGSAEDVLGEGRARADFAAFLAVALAERSERNQPIVELLTADSERMLRALVGTGDVAVKRHGDVQLERAHRNPPRGAERFRPFKRGALPAESSSRGAKRQEGREGFQNS